MNERRLDEIVDLTRQDWHPCEDPWKWDRRFLAVAETIAGWSKDPSTKTGAVITTPDRRILSMGYNGFAKGVKDTPERYADRDLKYKMVVHCEVNAILFAQTDLTGCTLYTWPFMSCCNCAAIVIQSGITRCVAPPTPADKVARWADSLNVATMMFAEAGVRLDILTEDGMVNGNWATS